jgi:hypothetical protein
MSDVEGRPVAPPIFFCLIASAITGNYGDGVDGARTGINLVRGVPIWLSLKQPSKGAPSMEKSISNLSSVTTVGLDLAKLVFQVHCVDTSGRVVVAKTMKRKKVLVFFAALPPCLVGLEGVTVTVHLTHCCSDHGAQLIN